MKYIIFFSLFFFVACSSDTDRREASAFFLRGNAKFKEKEYHESVKWYNEAIKKMPSFPDAYYNRGLVFQEMEKNEEALADFTQAFAQDPTFSPALYKRVDMLQTLHQLDEALVDVNKLTQTFPDSAANWSLQGNVRMEKNDWNGALSSYERALKLDSNAIETLINQGVVYQELNQLDLAEQIFRKALTKGKFKDLIYNNLGYVEIRRMHWALAAEYVKKALQIDPKNPLYVKNWQRVQQKSALE